MNLHRRRVGRRHQPQVPHHGAVAPGPLMHSAGPRPERRVVSLAAQGPSDTWIFHAFGEEMVISIYNHGNDS